MMNINFLFLIFNPNVLAGTHITEVRKCALDNKYTMFAFNGIVYSAKSENELFKLSDLVS